MFYFVNFYCDKISSYSFVHCPVHVAMSWCAGFLHALKWCLYTVLTHLYLKGFADKDVHSLHLTVSVCRNVTYADLLERIIPPALSNFAEQHVNIRKSLAVGYLDMTGVLECDYPLFKTGGVKYAFNESYIWKNTIFYLERDRVRFDLVEF